MKTIWGQAKTNNLYFIISKLQNKNLVHDLQGSDRKYVHLQEWHEPNFIFFTIHQNYENMKEY